MKVKNRINEMKIDLKIGVKIVAKIDKKIDQNRKSENQQNSETHPSPSVICTYI